MREVQVVAFCDRHWRNEDERVPADDSFVVTIDGVELTLDLCEDCAVEVRVAMDMFAELGSGDRARKKGPKPKRLDCTLCDYVGENRGALAAHYKRNHKMSIREAVE